MIDREKDEGIKTLRRELLKTREELDHRYRDLGRIYEIVNSIHSSLKLTDLSHVSKAIIERTLGLKAFSLVIYDYVAKKFIVVETKNLDKKVEKQALETVKQSAESLEVQRQRTARSEIIRVQHDDGTRMIYIPLIAYHRIVGGLCTNEDMVTQADWGGEEMLSLVTSQMTMALENSILYEITRKLSITDDKTKVFNHRYLTSRLNLELRRAQRHGHNLSFMMIDIDKFKQYNDIYGHIKGDKVLAGVAGILTSLCREIDVVARFGGDEFAVVLLETDLAGAEILAQRISSKMQTHLFEGNERRDQHLTLSIGIAAYPHHSADVREIVQLADKALFEAKKKTDSRYMVAETAKKRKTQ